MGESPPDLRMGLTFILHVLLALTTTTTTATARTVQLQLPGYATYPHVLYYFPSVVPYFNIEVSKPLQKEEVVVALNDEDIADILEIPQNDELECLEEGSFPHPVYCDKFFTCTTTQSGELQIPLLLLCQQDDPLSRIWISSSVEVTCSTSSQAAGEKQFCNYPGLTTAQREMCEKNHWKHSDGF